MKIKHVWTLLISGSILGYVTGQGCPYGWVDYPSSESCYYVSEPALNYNFVKAASKCQSHQSQLVGIDAKKELDFLKKQVKTAYGSSARTQKNLWWVGLRGDAKGGVNYLNGSSVKPFVTTKSSGSIKNACGVMDWNGTIVMTLDCYKKWISYICERPKNISLTCDVDNQWRYSNGACYKMFSPKRSWEDARRSCIEHDADLAKMNDRDALALIWDLARSTGSGTYWLGLRADSKKFLWTDNAAMGKSYWDRGEPKSFGSKKTPVCVAVNGAVNRRLASWVTLPCSKQASFTCSKKPGVCPDGWLQHQTSCYRFDLPTKLSWTDAKSFCRYIGGDLVMPKSASDQAFIAAYTDRMKDAGVDGFWFGLSDEKGSSGWIWSDGTNLDPSAADWAQTPSKNTPGKRDCAYINTANSKWRTSPACSKERAFACEVPAGKPLKSLPSIPAADQCETGWKAAGSYCLDFHDHTGTWYQAVSQCQSENAELLVIASDYIQAYLEGNLLLGETYWLGLSDREEEGSFVWVNGSKVTTMNWFKGEPQTNSDKNCAILQSDGKTVAWKMDSCQSSQKYMCYKKAAKPRRRRMSAASTTTAAPYDEACGKEWELRKSTDFCYQFRDTKLSWVDALDVCSHHNGSLVSITSRDEQSYLEGRLKGLSSVAVWIGANDRDSEAGWSWTDGSPFGFLNWFPGEPNNMGNKEDCSAINTLTMAWYDYPCETRSGFICKKEAISPTTVTPTPVTKPVSLPKGKFYGCEPGWLAYQQSCFLMRKTEVSWIDAQTACRKEGAELTSINSLQENQVIFSFLPKVSCRNAHSNDTDCKAWADMGECQKNPRWMSVNCKEACTFCKQTCSDKHTQNECQFWASIGECSKNKWMPENCALSCGCDESINYGFWIGLNDRQSQMSFVWSDLSPLTFTNWAKNEPNNYNGKNEDCVKMFSLSGEWSDEVCDENSSGYICKKKMEILDHPTVSPNNVGCPIGAFGYRAMCYMRVDLPMSWLDAKQYCNQRKAHLATITDSITGAFVTSELIGKASSYWLGLRSVGNRYSWISGAKVMYTPWAPSHTGNENNTCVAIRSQRPVGLWEDTDCQKQQPFICEVWRVGYSSTVSTTLSTSASPTTPSPCAKGWTGFQNNCYKLHTDLRTWSEGQATCQQYGGSLVSIHDDSTKNFLSSQLSYPYNIEKVWIGLSDKTKESSFTWSDGSPFDYSMWASNEPNNAYGVEDCVKLNRYQGSWNDNSCYSSAAFICAVPRGFPIPSIPPTVVTSPAPTCADAGWFYRNGFCYFISPSYGVVSTLTWHEANRKCMSSGGHLTSVASQAENDFILSLISKRTSANPLRFWIGFNELGQKSYQWSDGSPPIFLAWSEKEPNDAWGGQKCVNMYSDSGRWNDDNCMDSIGYICKKLNGSAVPNIPVPTAIIKSPCPPGFTGSGLNNKCYYLGGLGNKTNDPSLNWTAARDTCRQLQSSTPVDIASISDRLDQDYITLLIRDLKKSVWIGLTDQETHRTFKWQDNSEVTFTNWGQGEPNDHWSMAGERDCVEIVTDPTFDPLGVGKWKIQVCQKKNVYLCQTFKAPVPAQSTSSPTVTTSQTGSSQCPSNYFLYNNVCFNFVPQFKSWQDARKACQFFDGDLASTLDVFELARLDLELYNHHVLQQVWIGLSYNTDSSSYQWSDDWPLEATFWSRNDPDRQTNDSCVVLYRGKWNDTDCNFLRPFICAIRKDQPPTLTPTPTGLCADPSQILYGDFCYLPRLSERVSWPEAVYACGQMNMDLVSVHSIQESTFLYKVIKSQPQGRGTYWNYGSSSSRVWLGLNRDSNDGFRWSDDSDVNFFYWAEGEPSSKISSSSTNFSVQYDEACVEMDPDSAKWYDAACIGKNQGYICKDKKIMPSTEPTFTQNKITRQNPTPAARTEKRQYIGHSTLKEPKSGLTGGQVAGIVLGIICFFVIASVILFIVRQRFQFRKFKSWVLGQDSGFDNALYKHHVTGKGDGSIEDNGLDQMSHDNSVTFGDNAAFKN